MKITQRARHTAIAVLAAAAIGGSSVAVGAATTAPVPAATSAPATRSTGLPGFLGSWRSPH